MKQQDIIYRQRKEQGNMVLEALDFAIIAKMNREATFLNSSISIVQMSIEKEDDKDVLAAKQKNQEPVSLVGSVIYHSSPENFTDQQEYTDAEEIEYQKQNSLMTQQQLKETASFPKKMFIDFQNQQQNIQTINLQSSKCKLLQKLQAQKQKKHQVNPQPFVKYRVKSSIYLQNKRLNAKTTRQKQCISTNNKYLSQKIEEDLQFLNKYQKNVRWR